MHLRVAATHKKKQHKTHMTMTFKYDLEIQWVLVGGFRCTCSCNFIKC